MTGALAFERLKDSLPGRWHGARPDGRPVGVEYRVSASGSALVETWALGKDVEALTIYHLDGDSLAAAHFCPLGNQPRLRLAGVSGDRFDFAFRDGTGLGPGTMHQRRFWIALGGDGEEFEREEFYGDGLREESERISYRRVR